MQIAENTANRGSAGLSYIENMRGSEIDSVNINIDANYLQFDVKIT